jgi:hypothetical protein
MALSKQEVIEKILSFNYKKLADWIRSRLHGDDKYFPIYEGYETNLSKFLSEAFYHIKDEKFRENFLEILEDLTTELWRDTKNKDSIKGNEEYIYELLSLCGRIERFERKTNLYRIARSAKLKGFKAFNKDLHLMLLRSLASYKAAGDYDFWIDQMKDDSNKYYANAAFYALLNRQYDLDFLFDYIAIFVDRFKEEIDLVLGIKALVKNYNPKDIIKRFKGIESKLTMEQKEAVNHAFKELKYSKPYKISLEPDKESIYKPVKPALSMVGEKKVEYRTAKILKQKAGEIFEQMGFEVEFNRQMAGYSIDIFIKKKKTFGNKYECYICQCHEGEQKVIKDEVNHFLIVREAVDGCDAIIISKKGFTKGAVEMAGEHGIELKTLENLESDLRNFNSQLGHLIQK